MAVYFSRIHAGLRFLTVCVIAVACFMLFGFSVHASSSNNLSGYAWSENIGWISFNSTNVGNNSGYGGEVRDNGKWNGYAWSEHIGWIDLRTGIGCPTGPCRATIDSETGALSGWIRAEAGREHTDGWDGWISLSGNGYGLELNKETCQIEGYAWGSDVVGWVHFSGSNYGVQLTNSPLCEEPTFNYDLSDKIIVDFNADGATLVSEWINAFVEEYPNSDNAGWGPSDVDNISEFISNRFGGNVPEPLIRLVEDYHIFNSDFYFIPSLNGVQQVGNFNVTVVVGGDLQGESETLPYTITMNEYTNISAPITGEFSTRAELVRYDVPAIADGEIQFIDIAGGNSGNPPISFDGNITNGQVNGGIEVVFTHPVAGLTPISGIILECADGVGGCKIPEDSCDPAVENCDGGNPCDPAIENCDPPTSQCMPVSFTVEANPVVKFLTPNILSQKREFGVTTTDRAIIQYDTVGVGDVISILGRADGQLRQLPNNHAYGPNNARKMEFILEIPETAPIGEYTGTLRAVNANDPTCVGELEIEFSVVDLGDVIEF